MNESEANKLIKNSVNNAVINDTGKINQINKKLSKIKFGVLFFKYISHILFILIILIFFPLAFVKLNIFNFNNNKFLLPIVNYNNDDNNDIYQYNLNIKLNKIIPEYNISDGENDICKSIDPFNLTKKRFKNKPIEVCKSKYSSHICYKNSNKMFVTKNGVICTMTNVIIDPSKWRSDGHSYILGPTNNITRGCPLLSKGFFNMKCDNRENISKYTDIYENYFNSWNYDSSFDKKNIKNIKKLAPGKTVFFISRNQDSPNLYFGSSGVLNAIAMIYFFDLDPEKIQVIFLESMKLDNDPFYVLYKNIISRGGVPIHISELKERYLISSAIHVPINWDSPTFMVYNVQHCKYQSKAYYYLNQFINKYMNITEFKDPITYDDEVFYYPKSVVDPNSKNYTKFLTFQWRKAWPKGRKGQGRLIGNGPEMIEKLYEVLPKHILIRLIDTASLSLTQQISLMRKTDIYVGVHGAGLMLSAFMPTTSILVELSLLKKTHNLVLMSRLSGHKTYSYIMDAPTKEINGSQYIFFDPALISQKILQHINDTKY